MCAVASTALLGCEHAGRIVIVLDNSEFAPGAEVVALRADALDASGSNVPAATADSVARLRAIDDSVARLGERFRASRDSINREVAALDSLDRRTRTYAVRYADIRRRTLAAEHTRTARDAARERAERLRTHLAASLATVRAADGEGSPSSVRRTPIAGRSFALELPPGEWMVGIAPAGGFPARYTRVTARAGGTDTLRLARPR